MRRCMRCGIEYPHGRYSAIDSGAWNSHSGKTGTRAASPAWRGWVLYDNVRAHTKTRCCQNTTFSCAATREGKRRLRHRSSASKQVIKKMTRPCGRVVLAGSYRKGRKIFADEEQSELPLSLPGAMPLGRIAFRMNGGGTSLASGGAKFCGTVARIFRVLGIGLDPVPMLRYQSPFSTENPSAVA
jgi:hypothetical protein